MTDTDEIEERAVDVFDNHYDGPSDPASFRKAVAQVWVEATAAERGRLKSVIVDLAGALKGIVPRFERCIIRGGTSPEFAQFATKKAAAAIARADKELKP